MSNKYKINLWSAAEGYHSSLDIAAKWAGFSYMTDCPAFHFSISHGSHQPYWMGKPPRDAEWHIINAYVKSTKRSKNFIDIGGHIGTMSIPFSKIYDHVYTFEPVDTNYNFLSENIRINNIDNISSFNMAISDSEFKIKMVRHDDHNTGCYQMVNDNNGQITCKTLDSFKLNDVDFIKIDVQGGEIKVLKGAMNTIRKYKPFLMIEADEKDTDYTCSKTSIIDMLTPEGYHIYHDNGADIFMCAEEITYVRH